MSKKEDCKRIMINFLKEFMKRTEFIMLDYTKEQYFSEAFIEALKETRRENENS